MTLLFSGDHMTFSRMLGGKISKFFVDALNGGDIAITDRNVSDLELLCKEFKYADLSGQVEDWFSVNSSLDREARRDLVDVKGRIAELEQKVRQQNEADQKLEELRGIVANQQKRISLQEKMIEDLVTQVKGIVPKVTLDMAKMEEYLKAEDQRHCDELKAIPKMAADLSNFQQELAKLKEEMENRGKTERFNRPEGQPMPPGPGKQFKPADALFAANAWKPKQEQDEAPGVPLNGIIAHMTRECGGNVHDYGVVTVTASTVYRDSYSAKMVVDLENRGSYFMSSNRKESWICYDFGGQRIIPTHYAIRANYQGVNGNHLKNWVVEISMNGKTWTEVDRKENNGEMNAKLVTRTFAVSRSEECRFIRLVNRGKNWAGDDWLQISAWEVFGTLLAD